MPISFTFTIFQDLCNINKYHKDASFIEKNILNSEIKVYLH